jgi:hypothetical protein
MLSYLRCIKSHRGSNDSECRGLSKSYLSCRMDRYVHRPLLLLIRAPLPCHKYPKLLLQGARKGGEASCDTDMSECFGPGIRKDSNGSKGSRLQRFCTSHSSHLSTSETLPLSNRQSSSPLCSLQEPRLSIISTCFRHTASAASEQGASLPRIELE